MIHKNIRLVVLVYILLTVQVLVTSLVPIGGPQPQLILPLCVYLGITRFSIASSLVVFGSGLLVDGLAGAVVGPWAGASVVAFLCAGLIARGAFFPSLPLFAGVLMVASSLAFAVFHGLHLADTRIVPPVSLIFAESASTVAVGVFLIFFIRWWLEPSSARAPGDTHRGARRYV